MKKPTASARHRAKPATGAPEGALRLQKYLADAGLCSRRDADALVQAGRVMVNGAVAQVGQKVVPGVDEVKVDGSRVRPRGAARLTLVMHKPKGLVCSNDDPHNPATVFDLLPAAWAKERLFVAGRLDKDSEGLLVLTNDGELAQRLTHPRHQVIKRYRVLIHRDFDPAHIETLLKGVTDEGELLKAEAIYMAREGADAARRLEIHLNHGRKREIRRMLAILHYYVEKLVRFQIGKLTLRGLAPGAFRILRERDLRLLLAETGHDRARPGEPERDLAELVDDE